MLHLASIFLTFVLLTLMSHGQATQLVGKIVVVTDGDTVTLLDRQNRKHKIRLSGIDAPEKKQPFSQRSKQSLSELIFAKHVVVHTSKRDRYGRFVGRVQLGDVDINLEQLRGGMAWNYKAYESEQPALSRQLYSDAEDRAREKKTGLWRDAHPIPPWSYRRQARAASACRKQTPPNLSPTSIQATRRL